MKHLKTLLCLCAVLLLPAVLKAQESPMQKWLRSFEGRNGITTVSITSAMFKLLSKIGSADPGYKDVVSFASKLQDFKVIVVEDEAPSKTAGRSEFNRLIGSAPLGGFEELMSVKESRSQIIFRVLQQDNHIRELVMTITGSDQAIIFIKGDFKLNELTRISDNVDIAGMDKIKKLKK